MDIPKNLKKCVLSFINGDTNGYPNWQKEDLTWVDTGHSDGVMVFKSAVVGRLLNENMILREALDKIASWGEGDIVSGKFDEPYSASIARKALNHDK